MQKFELFRVFLAQEFLKLGARNVVLGAVVQQIIKDEYLPKLERELERIREDDVSKRAKIEQAIEVWEAEARNSEWNDKAVSIIRRKAQSFKYGNSEVEEASQDIATSIYTDRSFYSLLYGYDPLDGPSPLMGKWLKSINYKAINYFRDLISERALDRKLHEMEDDDGGYRSPLDDVSGGLSEDEAFSDAREADRIMREMRLHVLRDPKVKRSEEATAIFNVWLEALDRVKHRGTGEGLARIKFKRDVAPKIQKKYDIGYHQILNLYRKYILPALAEYLAEEFRGEEAYFEKMLKAKDVSVVERIASDFYVRDMKAWLLAPALYLQRAVRDYAEV